jgi:hypothetical protein
MTGSGTDAPNSMLSLDAMRTGEAVKVVIDLEAGS